MVTWHVYYIWFSFWYSTLCHIFANFYLRLQIRLISSARPLNLKLLVPSLSETNLKSKVSKIVPKDQVQSLAIHLSLLLSQLQSLAFLSDMKLWYPWIVRGYGLQLDHCNQEWEIDLRLRGQGQKLDHWPGTESSFIFRVEELENDLMLRSLVMVNLSMSMSLTGH